MKAKNEYSIKIAGINSGWTTYRIWKNDKDIDPDELTIEEMVFFQKELYDFSEMFKNQIKYLEEL